MHQSSRFKFHLSSSRSTAPFQWIHSSLWGPAPEFSCSGFRYSLIFIDDFSKYTWIFPLIRQSESFHSFCTKINFNRMVEGNMTIKTFLPFSPTMAYINHFLVHTPLNKWRKGRHIVETGLSWLHQAFLPRRFWMEAFSTAVYLINRLPSPSLDSKSPYSFLFHCAPDYATLRTFGSQSFPFLGATTRQALSKIKTPSDPGL